MQHIDRFKHVAKQRSKMEDIVLLMENDCEMAWLPAVVAFQ